MWRVACWLLVGCGRIDFADDCTPIGGLLGDWPMEAGDIRGSTLLDRSGNLHDGTIMGTPAPVLSSGKHGLALDFGAGGAWVEIANMPFDATPGAAYTFAMWMLRPGTTPANDVLFDAPPPNPPSDRYDLWLIDDSLCVNTASDDCWGITEPLLDRWVHVAAILRNGPTIDSELYIDGEARTLTCTRMPCVWQRTVANPLTFGALDAYRMRGMLDEVRVYDHALTPVEITAVFDQRVCSSASP